VITVKHDESLTAMGRFEIRRFDNEAFEEAWLNAVTYNDWVTFYSGKCIFFSNI